MLSISSPIAILAGVRPVSQLRADLTQVLKDGRLIAAQVLENSGPGRSWIGLAGLRVEADTEVDLEPGQRFLAQVEEHDGKIVLRLVPPTATEDEVLVDALRSVVAEALPAGERIDRLASSLRDAVRTSTPEQARVIETLVHALRSVSVPPQVDGPALKSAVQGSGLFHESWIALAASVAGTPLAAEAAGIARTDLKGLLLAALDLIEDEPARVAIRHAIAGIEADQLLEVARARAGEPQVVSLPIPDLQSWASAHVMFDRERDEARDSGEGDGANSEEASSRATRHARLAVRFSNLGSVRADFDLTSTDLRVRFTVERADVAELLRQDLPRLVAEVGVDGRPSIVTVFESPQLALDATRAQAETNFLRDHPLMDLSG